MVELITIAGEAINNLDVLKAGLLLLAVFFSGLFFSAHYSGKLDWTDLITSKGTSKVSLTKLLQFIGGIVATWVILYQTMDSNLSTELFCVYLLYVASIEGYSKFMAAKYGVGDSTADAEKRKKNAE